MPTQPTLDSTRETEKTLLAAAQRAASGVGDAVEIKAAFRFIAFELVVSAYVAGGGGDQLNVYVQQSWDGSNWDDLVGFTAYGGAGTTEGVQVATLPIGRDDQAAEVHPFTEGTLAGARNTLLSRRFRVQWVLVAAGPTTRWTFGVYAFTRNRGPYGW